MLHLYRVYGLHPVIHENLRPEKAAKPFPRMVKEEAAAAAVAAGEGAEATPTPRKRAKRAKATLDETAGMYSALLVRGGRSLMRAHRQMRWLYWRLGSLRSRRTSKMPSRLRTHSLRPLK